eukprot:m.315476 g.315476  ORF g.315476 m.315476 type:complete len:67 (+) comp676331_c0_seq1:10-210(+)
MKPWLLKHFNQQLSKVCQLSTLLFNCLATTTEGFTSDLECLNEDDSATGTCCGDNEVISFVPRPGL